jgi:hypothetical protein
MLDALGAICVLWPVLRLSPVDVRRLASLFWKGHRDAETGLVQLRWAKIGLGLLLTGFALQIVGTWLRCQ